ncbi:hypothetical protein LRS06_22410 [Hymenobacter sp. J193]|uniref:hypothetical protein n=1 Tax=Hymenobacter sp. J193 TaxID=2898429 RepID=UPI0021508686|nr:hypothetical protein [Hymenobacter sp. J193]MCR5890485.1 hypothetical protein [Hymenobacter sp. J193]
MLFPYACFRCFPPPGQQTCDYPGRLGPQLPNPALAIAYDEARRYVQLRLRSLPHGGLRATCTAYGFPYTTSVGLKTGSLQREEYRLVQKHLRVFGFETELVRLYVSGQLCEHYLLPTRRCWLRCASSWPPTRSWSASCPPLLLFGFDSCPGFRRRGWFVPLPFYFYARNFSPRDNDPQELDRFKQSIDLADYATRRHGYDVKKAGPRGHWHQLEKDSEMLIVSRKGDHQVYLNPGDDRDSGSIIDSVKTRENQTLGQVRQTLRQYLGEPEQGWQAATSPTARPGGVRTHAHRADRDGIGGRAPGPSRGGGDGHPRHANRPQLPA